MAGGALLVGLDVGVNETRAVVARAREARNGGGEPLRILGVGVARTEGMTRATVTNLEATTESIRESIQAAELMAGHEVERAYVGVAGVHAHVARSRGVVAVSGAEVHASHLRQVEEVGRAVAIPPDRELIHALCQEYAVDGRGGIEDPIGMTATRLESDVCLVTADSTACRDLRRAVDRAGYRPAELVLEPLASSLAVLRDAEREAEVALVEMGAANTDVVVFHGRRVRYMRSLPWGANTVTRDIARGLGVPEDEAARLKDRHGAARRADVDAAERLELSGPSGGPARDIARDLLAHIIEQRMDEIFGLVYEQLDDAGLLDRLGAGVVLTGEGVSLPGTVELARSVFNLPVRLGEPGGSLIGMADAVRRTRFSTSVGLALYGSMRAPRGRFSGAGRLAGRLSRWLKDFF